FVERETLFAQRKGVPVRRETLFAQRKGSPAQQKGSPVRREAFPVEQKGSPVRREREGSISFDSSARPPGRGQAPPLLWVDAGQLPAGTCVPASSVRLMRVRRSSRWARV